VNEGRFALVLNEQRLEILLRTLLAVKRNDLIRRLG
jgi:hypothetical protein